MGAFLALLGCQLAGEVAHRRLGIPIPGPVLGLLSLVVVFALSGGPSETMRRSAQLLLGWMPLLFVPAGAGVIAHLTIIRAEWLPITASLVVSSAITILVTAATVRTVERLQTRWTTSSPLPGTFQRSADHDLAR